MKDEAKFMEKVLNVGSALKHFLIVDVDGPLLRWQTARAGDRQVSAAICTNFPVQIMQSVVVIWSRLGGGRTAAPFGEAGTPGASQRFQGFFRGDDELSRLQVTGPQALFDALCSQAMPSKLQLTASNVLRTALSKEEAIAELQEHVGNDGDSAKFCTDFINVVWAIGAFAQSQYAFDKEQAKRVKEQRPSGALSYGEICNQAAQYVEAKLAEKQARKESASKPAKPASRRKKKSPSEPAMIEHTARGETLTNE